MINDAIETMVYLRKEAQNTVFNDDTEIRTSLARLSDYQSVSCRFAYLTVTLTMTKKLRVEV